MPSEKILNEKKAAVSALAEKIKNAGSCVLVDYCGLSVQEDTDLRRQLRAAGVDYSVIKNTLARFAMKEAGYGDTFDQILNGTTSIALSGDDVVAPARVLCKFAKTNDKLKSKRVIDGGICRRGQDSGAFRDTLEGRPAVQDAVLPAFSHTGTRYRPAGYCRQAGAASDRSCRMTYPTARAKYAEH